MTTPRTRVIPLLLLRGESLVKTVRFGKFTYVGDPCNTVRIFNELEVDELLFLDITATVERRSPNLRLLADIAEECFMPLAYGGGISHVEHAKAVFDLGFEKVAVNSAATRHPKLIEEIARIYGSQAVVASIDVRSSSWGSRSVFTESGRRNARRDPVSWARELESMGAGEILLTAVEREGSWTGFDVDLVRSVADEVTVPVVAHGGAGSIQHIVDVVRSGHASAVAVGSLVVFQRRGMGVLVNFPNQHRLAEALASC